MAVLNGSVFAIFIALIAATGSIDQQRQHNLFAFALLSMAETQNPDNPLIKRIGS